MGPDATGRTGGHAVEDLGQLWRRACSLAADFGLPGRCEHAARRVRDNITTPPVTLDAAGLEEWAEVAALDGLALRRQLALRRAEGIANASAARELSALKGFVAFARAQLGDDAIAPRLRGPRLKKGLPRPVTPDEAVNFALEHNPDLIAARERYIQVVGKAPVNLRRLTNLGTFRAYAHAYLQAHKGIRDDMTLLVRQLDPGPQGLPIEIYCFTATTAWNDYEDIQSDIFDHLLAILPEFGLRAYQAPSGADLWQGLQRSEWPASK